MYVSLFRVHLFYFTSLRSEAGPGAVDITLWYNIPPYVYTWCLLYSSSAGLQHVLLCVLFTFEAFFPNFLPVGIQHNQCPCRFFNPKRDTFKFCGHGHRTTPQQRYYICSVCSNNAAVQNRQTNAHVMCVCVCSSH